MPDGRPEPNTPPVRAEGSGDRCEPARATWQALDRTYAVLLELLRELEAAYDTPPAPAAA